jgi:predicted nucleic acid-binding protein
VSKIFFLDSGPLGLLTHPKQTEEVISIMAWLSQMLKQGNRILVPAIVYYELKRELLRADKPFSVARLDVFIKTSNRYIPLTDEALRLAAELWAKVRQQGQPTADSKELDIDVLLAAQALTFEAATGEVVVVTTNAKHLSRFVTAKHWDDILP